MQKENEFRFFSSFFQYKMMNKAKNMVIKRARRYTFVQSKHTRARISEEEKNVSSLIIIVLTKLYVVAG